MASVVIFFGTVMSQIFVRHTIFSHFYGGYNHFYSKVAILGFHLTLSISSIGSIKYICNVIKFDDH